MKLAQITALGLTLAALAGCDTMKREQAGTDSMSRSSATASTLPGSTSGTAMQPADATAQSAQDPQTMQPNAVVVSIEPMARASAMAGSSSMGATGTSAAKGSPDDMVHRVTLRMDDGSTRILVHETSPVFKSGDRVTVANEMIYYR